MLLRQRSPRGSPRQRQERVHNNSRQRVEDNKFRKQLKAFILNGKRNSIFMQLTFLYDNTLFNSIFCFSKIYNYDNDLHTSCDASDDFLIQAKEFHEEYNASKKCC